jgi:N-methylhydantoinase A
MPLRYRVGVDIGGTFTDIVLLDSAGSIATRKVLSTSDDYGRGIIVGLQELFEALSLPAEALDGVVHGTTVATNAILEGKGARAALITTRGFRDVLELRRIRIPKLYDLFYEKPAPLVPRRLRFEVDERIGPAGEVRRPLDRASVEAAIERIRAAGVEAVAVSLLHSYANPTHERAIGDMLRAGLPQAHITCSVDILPEIREYERTSTAVVNAYVGPIVQRYLAGLLRRLRAIGVTAPLRLMQSNGGVMTAEAAMEQPAHIVESGPAAGVIATAELARLAGYPNVIAFDMGGTTTKASMIENGEMARTTEYEVGGGINLSSQLVRGGGYTLKLPFIDISEIGAGGGSIVWIDKGGMLQIGPHSAGAMPGPACYDQGGAEPTITDALVTLGYINPQYLAGGRVRLNAGKARQVIQERVAAPLRLSLNDAAYGVYVIASARMVRAVKAVSTYRGRDPRDFVLVGFGGNGPVFSAELARALQMKRVLIPPAPGLFSAFGLLFANVEYQLVQTMLRRAATVSLEELNAGYDRLADRARADLIQDGYRPEQIAMRRYADLRYAGQAYELTVPVPDGLLGPAEVAGMVERFGQEHLTAYGHRAADEPVDLVNLRLVGYVPREQMQSYDPAAAIRAGDAASAGRVASRRAYFGPQHGVLETPVLARRDLAGRQIAGPLIVEEYDATCVVPPGCEAGLDAWGNIVIDIRG